MFEKIEASSNKVIYREFIENPHTKAILKKGLLVGTWLLNLKPDIIKTTEPKESTALTLLHEAGVDLKVLQEGNEKERML